MQQSAVFWWKSKMIFPSKNVLIHSLKRFDLGRLVSRSQEAGYVVAKLEVNSLCFRSPYGSKKQRKV